MPATTRSERNGEPLLKVAGLGTNFHTDAGTIRAVDDVGFEIRRGEALGIVGESGSGKSVTALSLLRLIPVPPGEFTGGTVVYDGRDILRLAAHELRAIRGGRISMIFQEPMTSLNPVYTIGEQIAEAVLLHERTSRKSARERAVRLMREVMIPDPASRVDAYPHELSGGMKQRAMIAMALASDPDLLIADEPTTALDVTVQAQILKMLSHLRRQRGMALVFISHDLGVIAQVAERIAVMRNGKVVETGETAEILRNPRHPYTKGLLACRPRLDGNPRRLPTVEDFFDEKKSAAGRAAPPIRRTENRSAILVVENLSKRFGGQRRIFGKSTAPVVAVENVAFRIDASETLGLVGESGCGKTTLGRLINRIVEPDGGKICFMDEDLLALAGKKLREKRRFIQMIFQDPAGSLNPRLEVETIVTEGMLIHGIGRNRRERRDMAARLLERCGLSASHMRRYPHEFSGGQRQRISIARALAVGPRLLICDEAVSALDVSVQAQILNLLKDIQDERGVAYLFISHDLSVVKFMSDRIAVMNAGKIVEVGTPDEIYRHPKEDYTRELIAAIPKIDVPGA